MTNHIFMSASFAIFLYRREIMPERLSFTVSGMFRYLSYAQQTGNTWMRFSMVIRSLHSSLCWWRTWHF